MGIKNRNIVANVPNLRFQNFSEEWEEKNLNDLCSEFRSGKNIKSEDILEFGLYPVFGGNGLRGFTNLYNHEGTFVLIGRQGALCGNIHFVRGKCYITEHAIAVQANEHNHTGFLRYLLSKMNLGQYSDQSAQPGLAVNKLLKLNATIPNLPEQTKIANFLTLLDERISTQSQIIQRLKSSIQNLNNNLKELYGNKIEISLHQLGTSYSGLSGKSAEDFGSGKPFVTYMNVYKNIVVDERMVEYVSVDENETQNKVQYGDVLFTVSSETPQEVGMSAVYLGNNDELYLNSFCFGYRLYNFDTLLPEYMPYLFSCKQFRKILSPLAQGSTRFNLQKNDFLKKKFKIPTTQNQKKISSVLNALSEKLKIEQNLLLEYQNQKKYLLSQMFI